MKSVNVIGEVARVDVAHYEHGLPTLLCPALKVVVLAREDEVKGKPLQNPVNSLGSHVCLVHVHGIPHH